MATNGIYTIGIDGVGGDYAPQEVLKGVELFSREERETKVVIFGPKDELVKTSKELKIDIQRFDIVDAPELITMSDSAARSVVRKKNSSIVLGTKLLKEGKIDAFISCGNTGAVVCTSSLNVGLIKDVLRPGIAILVPTLKGTSLIIDVGANIDPKPVHFLQYGVMASIYYSTVLGKKEPSIGILNIGEEDTKGGELIKEAYKLLERAPLNFSGNIEAKDIFNGDIDCIICDGFSGNVALKVSEGVVNIIGKFILDCVERDLFAKLGLLLMKNALKNFRKITDYAEYGGAPLLGVDGVVIIGHGRSKAKAVKNAMRVAIKELRMDVNKEIVRGIDEISKDSWFREVLTNANNR